ncbi:hypothetical protein E2C01_047424 [Portunus trituberculatus]|uniref:DH domain-containing protein n=1 Tax=Portunus trituberculatus TaxID=210409 RepID=A0A5B7G7F3_PORTR|nr:hypothetical protein [Portunus trituberculatus]
MSGVTHPTLAGHGAHRDSESSCDRMMGQRRANLNYPPRPTQTPSDKRHIIYQILAEEEEYVQETRLVRDSIVRGQLSEFCGRASKSRKHLCMPGGRLDEAACGSKNSLFVIHAGTNDLENTRSEELMEKYKRMI